MVWKFLDSFEQAGDFLLPLDVPVWLFFWTSVLYTWQVISALLDRRKFSAVSEEAVDSGI